MNELKILMQQVIYFLSWTTFFFSVDLTHKWTFYLMEHTGTLPESNIASCKNVFALLIWSSYEVKEYK